MLVSIFFPCPTPLGTSCLEQWGPIFYNFVVLVCWGLTSLCHSNGHIETMPPREINPFTALTRIRSQFIRTQWSKSNHQRVDMTTPLTAQPSGLATIFIYNIAIQNTDIGVLQKSSKHFLISIFWPTPRSPLRASNNTLVYDNSRPPFHQILDPPLLHVHECQPGREPMYPC